MDNGGRHNEPVRKSPATLGQDKPLGSPWLSAIKHRGLSADTWNTVTGREFTGDFTVVLADQVSNLIATRCFDIHWQVQERLIMYHFHSIRRFLSKDSLSENEDDEHKWACTHAARIALTRWH
jgi:hypothetical protein